MTQLARSSRNRVLFGVCGGLGERFGWDPVWIRLAFVLLTLAGGPGVVLYLVMTLIVPRDRNVATWHPAPRHPGVAT
jgi:phage shock protein PspC (stress-responsive transcriptional regulator)